MRLLVVLVLAGEPHMRRRGMTVTGHRPKIAARRRCRVLITGALSILIALVLPAGTAAAQSSSKVAALHLPAGRAFDWSYSGYRGARGPAAACLAGVVHA